MNELPPYAPFLIILGFCVFFTVMWSGVTLLLNHLGGWRRLAERYAGELGGEYQEARISSASFGRGLPVNYNGVLHLRVGPEGIGMRLLPIFALGARPLRLPWSALRDCRAWKSLGMFERFRFTVDGAGVVVTLSGRAAVLAREGWFRWGAAAGVTADLS